MTSMWNSEPSDSCVSKCILITRFTLLYLQSSVSVSVFSTDIAYVSLNKVSHFLRFEILTTAVKKSWFLFLEYNSENSESQPTFRRSFLQFSSEKSFDLEQNTKRHIAEEIALQTFI
jgi:archaellum biogenesis ATPase FlaH